VLRCGTRRAERGAARALEAPPPDPPARGCSRFLVRDRRRREKLRRPFDRREGLGAGDARRGRDAPFVAHAPGTHGSREPVSGAAACRRARATANGHRRFALSINTHSRERLGEFSAPEKRVRARCRDDWRSPGVTTARSMRRRSRGRVGRYAPGATRPSARVRVTLSTPPLGCSSSFRGLSCIFFTPVTPPNVFSRLKKWGVNFSSQAPETTDVFVEHDAGPGAREFFAKTACSALQNRPRGCLPETPTYPSRMWRARCVR
jgi:hypothetical protein